MGIAHAIGMRMTIRVTRSQTNRPVPFIVVAIHTSRSWVVSTPIARFPWRLKELRARSCGATLAWRTENTGFGQHGIEGGYMGATPAKVLLILSPVCILRLKMGTGGTEVQ
jgi:hypothetical protein